ncbi:MAG: carbohydrate ABC transporter permease [Planctomycetota bacterium]
MTNTCRRALQLLRFFAIAALAAVALLPLAWLVFKVRPASFAQLFVDEPVGRWMTNSLLIAGTSTLLACILSSVAGFAIWAYRFPGRRLVVGLLVITVLLPAHTLLPGLAAATSAAGLLDSPIAVILPGSLTAFGVFLYAVSFQHLPTTTLDAARIDGANELRVWWHLAMPMVRPATAAFLLLHFLGQWNALLWPAAVLLDEPGHTLPIGLAAMAKQATYEARPDLVAAATLLAIIPPAVWFLLCEREFSEGLER